MNTFDFAIGTRVYCQDGEWGKLARIVIDPDTLQVKELIIEKGYLFKQSRVFPVTVVTRATPEGIHLSLWENELLGFPQYTEGEYQPVTDIESRWADYQAVLPETLALQMTAASNHHTATHSLIVQEKIYTDILEHLAVLKSGTPIYGLDGEVGKLDHLMTEAKTKQITHIIAREGTLLNEHIPIPVSLIQTVKKDGIQIVISQDGLKNLNRYTWTENKLTPPPGGNQQKGEPGDKVSRLHILSEDLALRAIVANALSEDPETKMAIVEVINNNGVITLVGRVADRKTRQAAEKIAVAQPGVISVINSLQVDQGGDRSGENAAQQAREFTAMTIHIY